MIRLLDFLFCLVGIIILSPILALLLLIGFFDTGYPLFFQLRMGKNKNLFYLIKFRSMKLETKSVGTHLVDKTMLTNYGKFIRKTKLDELPQLLNVLFGQMSLVGPRPNLPNQIELISCRDKYNVYSVRPGITGLAQINKIDMSSPIELAEMDAKMIYKYCLFDYFKYIFLTVFGKGFGDRIVHNKIDI
jgi:lipopolysaccharide/colanic/teichoic acid biosynthesis glycosyltransferase